jgi:hypothetical protein
MRDHTGTLRRVCFQSDELAKRHRDGKLDPGLYTVEFRTGRKEMRHYTACSWDLAKGAFDVLFFKHGEGPGRTWADKLKVGDEVRPLGPGSRVAIDHKADRHVVIGDETSIGHARAVVENANGARIDGIIACSPQTAPLAKLAGAAFEPFAGETPAAHAEHPRLAGAEGPRSRRDLLPHRQSRDRDRGRKFPAEAHGRAAPLAASARALGGG